ncbi:glutathione S-transferase [Conchiformibius steedae]|uniref:glutathione S-transferase n=1 Tax=Conchiformibius steedae TaxID=153493 RepID=UPI0026F18D0C|nr:glutathione S-transferase [Conchiformibius steedae]
MITLYALKQSRAYRIAWLLEILQLDYQAEILTRHPDTLLAPESLRHIHPLGKSPIIQDDEVVLAESGAIVEYLLERYDTQHTLKPRVGSEKWRDYLYWLHYAEGSLMPLLVMSLVFRRIDDSPMPFLVKPVARKITANVRQSFLHPQLELHLNHVERALEQKTWLLGDDLSGADIMMSFPLQAALSRATGQLPNIAAYVARITEHPAYQRAETKLGQLDKL